MENENHLVNSPFYILNYFFAYEKSTAFAVLSVCR